MSTVPTPYTSTTQEYGTVHPTTNSHTRILKQKGKLKKRKAVSKVAKARQVTGKEVRSTDAHILLTDNATQHTNPLKLDPSRTITLRRYLSSELGKRFDVLLGKLKVYIHVTNASVPTTNAQAVVSSLQTLLNSPYTLSWEERHRLARGKNLDESLTSNVAHDEVIRFKQWLVSTVGSVILNGANTLLQKVILQAWSLGAGRSFEEVNRKRKAKLIGVPADPLIQQGMGMFQGGKEHYLQSLMSKSAAGISLLVTRVSNDLQAIVNGLVDTLVRDYTNWHANPKVMSKEDLLGIVANRVSTAKNVRVSALCNDCVVRANAEGQLDGFKELGVDRVKGIAEHRVTNTVRPTRNAETIEPDEKEVQWVTTSGNPCEECSSLEGEDFSIDEARGMIPKHPMCFCSWTLPDWVTDYMARDSSINNSTLEIATNKLDERDDTKPTHNCDVDNEEPTSNSVEDDSKPTYYFPQEISNGNSFATNSDVEQPRDWHGRWTKGEGASTLTDEHKQAYGQAMHNVISKMPEKCQQHILEDLVKVSFHPDQQNMTNAVRAQGTDIAPRDLVNGAYNHKTGIAYLNGATLKRNAPGMGGDQTNIEGTYAHELGHVIDRNYRYSDTKEWKRAWNAEIVGDKNKEANLSEYARMGGNREGFAEFCRLLWGSKVDRKEVESKFPKCVKVMKDNKLLD